MVPLHHILILSAVLFSIGFYGVLVRRNIIGILMSIELMLNAANLNLVAFSRYMHTGAFMGQVFVVFTITVAAAHATVALAMVLAIYRQRKTIKMDEINLMKW